MVSKRGGLQNKMKILVVPIDEAKYESAVGRLLLWTIRFFLVFKVIAKAKAT